MKNPKNWKHTTKQRHQYGERSTEKYDTPFMSVDEELAKVTLSYEYDQEEI